MRKFITLVEEAQAELFPGYDEQHRSQRLTAWLKNTNAVVGSRPRVLYHATTADFDSFRAKGTGFSSVLGMDFEMDRNGVFFAEDPEFAEEYIHNHRGGDPYKANAHVIPVYLSIQYPIVLTDNGLSQILHDEELVEEFANHDIDIKSMYFHVDQYDRWEFFDGEEGAEFITNLKRMGFDGAVMVERTDQAQNGTVWVAFDANQIKSAIGNRGSYSPTDDRFTH